MESPLKVFQLLLFLFLVTTQIYAKVNDMVKKEGGTLEQCAKSCVDERSIKCRYFKFINTTKTCIMSGTDHPDLQEFFKQQVMSGSSIASPREYSKEQLRRIVMITKRSYDEQKKRLELVMDKISALQSEYAKVEDFKSGLKDYTTELRALERERDEEMKMLRRDRSSSDHAQKLLAQKLNDVSAQTTDVRSSLKNIKDTQRTFSTEIEALRQAENDMYGNIVQINRKTTNLNNGIGNMQSLQGNIKNQLQELNRRSHSRDMQIESLRKDFLSRKASEEALKPEIVGIEKNQKTLAKALETVAHKVESLGGYLTGFEKSLDSFSQKMNRKLEDEKELTEEVKTITRALKDLRIDVNKLLNPQSSLNMERSQGLLKMKSDINLLSGAIHQLQQGDKGQKMDMTNLVRDLANVQLSSQDMKNQLSIVARANKQIQSQTSAIEEAERQKPSVVEVAQMHKRVLVALKAMENKEARLLDKVQQYQQAVNQIASRVKDAQDGNTHLQRSQLRYDQTIKQLSAQLAQLSSKVAKLEIPLKLSGGKVTTNALQSKALINQIMDLKNELFSLKTSITKLKKKNMDVTIKPIPVPVPENKSVKESTSEKIVDKILQEAEKKRTEKNPEPIKIRVKPSKTTTIPPLPLLKAQLENAGTIESTDAALNAANALPEIKPAVLQDSLLNNLKKVQKLNKSKKKRRGRRRRRRRRRRRQRKEIAEQLQKEQITKLANQIKLQ